MAEVNNRTVAILDDDNAIRDSLQFMLEVVGHPVETFASVAEFQKAEMQRLACLILDHHMPEITGLELAEQMRAAGVGIPILLPPDSPSPAIVVRAAEVGINWVLEKPVTEGDLLDFIDAKGVGKLRRR